ncbi:MAG: hypothetical protein A3G38_01750 [Omnitrophica WOR_2 bacterium RIFCSPLOWO2_12_FULL_51_8]|nr:MAG: hypothetical protein A3G38_01750 [Omnitrophica WOR_2 bacterium RIFCSPLOWO2_12_FULL_51_8]
MLLLSMFAVGLGRRAAINLKLARYQRDSLKARYLALAGVNLAAEVIKGIPQDRVYLTQTWSTGLDKDNKEIFKNIKLEENSSDACNISPYSYDDKHEYYLRDEERKINLNYAAENELAKLAAYMDPRVNSVDARQIAKDIRVWRGDTDPNLNPEDEKYKDFKKSHFKVNAELLTVLKYFYAAKGGGYQELAYDAYENSGDLATVYGGGKVNINTVDEKALDILLSCGAEQATGASLQDAQGLLEKIMDYRSKGGTFTDINLKDILAKPSDPQINIIDVIKTKIDIKSDNFRLISEGITAHSGTSRRIECVINRSGLKIAYWHEN